MAHLPIDGFLANCCAPESITTAMTALKTTGKRYVGGYANTFAPIPETWTLNGAAPTDGSLALRPDLDPEAYLAHVRSWWAAGATVVGGCCGTRPAHIAAIAAAFAQRTPDTGFATHPGRYRRTYSGVVPTASQNALAPITPLFTATARLRV